MADAMQVMQAMQVTVVYAPAPREVREWPVSLPAGSTVWQALLASGVLAEYPQLDVSLAGVGVWGQRVLPDQLLHGGERIEIYRPLRVDPKVARRERFRKQGAGVAGRFSQRRPGAKAGY